MKLADGRAKAGAVTESRCAIRYHKAPHWEPGCVLYNCWEHIRAVSTVLRLERAGGGPRSWAGALPIRLVLVSRLRLRQARDLWVFNRNELKTKGLPDGKSRDKNDVRLRV